MASEGESRDMASEGESGALSRGERRLLASEGKRSWPELVGKNGDEAVKIIETENPYVKAIVLWEGAGTTRDSKTTRVRVFVDKQRVVTEAPQAG